MAENLINLLNALTSPNWYEIANIFPKIKFLTIGLFVKAFTNVPSFASRNWTKLLKACCAQRCLACFLVLVE